MVGGGWERWHMWWLEFLRKTKNEDERGVDGVLKRESIFFPSVRGCNALVGLRLLRKTEVVEDERERREVSWLMLLTLGLIALLLKCT